jgi:DNA-binding response OmpR family regulator
MHARIPIVVMTALLDNPDVLNRADDLECEYLGKPFAPEALIAKIESARKMMAGCVDSPVTLATLDTRVTASRVMGVPKHAA